MSENTFWDNEVVLGSIDKNDRGEQIIVKECERKGKKYLDIRSYYYNKVDELSPGKGITFSLDLKDKLIEILK